MSALLNPLSAINDAAKTATGVPNVLGQGLAAGQQATGLLSGHLFSLGVPKHVPSIKDAFLTLFIAVVFHIFAIFKRFIPPFIWGFVALAIPPLIAFYEIKIRGHFPKLPSVFKIAIELHQRGQLTIGTLAWFVSSLPQGLIAGLGIPGLDLVNPSAVASGISHVVAGGKNAAEQATSVVTTGVTGTAHVVEGVTKAAADGISAVPGVPKVAKETVQTVVETTNTVVDAVSQTLTHPLDVAKNVSTLANALNPLNTLQNSQQTQPSALGNLVALQPKLLGKSLIG